ncbi:P2X purinoceptor 7-like [Siniperca chuatsi]|uniref:P2X purinoceptor 7-like n=1 Tax=Siniperca chuatsi TaxID=119488 RepID=UPI001CE135C1|nr:P2X purinoceptor 7-like [Siniperca chuatsi]
MAESRASAARGVFSQGLLLCSSLGRCSYHVRVSLYLYQAARQLFLVQNRCGELAEEPRCRTLHPGLEPVCLNPYSLQNALNTYQADHGPLEMKGRAVRARYPAYRCFVSWCWGYLGKHNRVVIPSCVVLSIHQEYPDEDGEYTGFKPTI